MKETSSQLETAIIHEPALDIVSSNIKLYVGARIGEQWGCMYARENGMGHCPTLYQDLEIYM